MILARPWPNLVTLHRFVLHLVFAGCVLLFSGCTSASFAVRVNATAKPGLAPATSYRLVEQSVSPEHQALFEETTRVVRRALASKGLNEATGSQPPDLWIAFNCGLGTSFQRTTLESQPVYTMVPGPIRYETVQVGTSANGSPIYQTVARRDPPTEELLGYDQRPVKYTIYRKHFRLSATATKPIVGVLPPETLWRVDPTCESQDKDVRGVLPVLAAASAVYLAKNLDLPEVILMKDSDKDVQLIRKRM